VYADENGARHVEAPQGALTWRPQSSTCCQR
jgi:hypothetical protein